MSNCSAVNAALAELGFHGSYRPQDITFLLKACDIQPTPVAEKERLIQSGLKHYSEMISEEKPPTAEHMAHFQHALKLGAERLAAEVQQLGHSLSARFPAQPVVLVSLVRAGVPLGVLLKHQLEKTQPCFHYGISIIRDRGLDLAALNAIIRQHGADNIVFVDGWTGKGAICRQLTQSLSSYPELFDEGWEIPRLVTLSDLGGYSWLSAGCEDWLIPFGILGSVISGLTSRSVLSADISPSQMQDGCLNPDHWHNCVIYDHLKADDLSLQFILQILDLIQQQPHAEKAGWSNAMRAQQQQRCLNTVQWIAQHYGVGNINLIKPSIAEATRAVLRRVPERILIQDPAHPDVQLLLHFAQERAIPVDILGAQLGPYHAVTLIKKVEKKQ
ncbi:cysteine protease StiP family protein [Acinetobacter sp.]|uniref:cysteine protease StiP family protein n=1 Tax=Acinetobacter sp. TaxID=472 RepID=UPI0035AFA451